MADVPSGCIYIYTVYINVYIKYNVNMYIDRLDR